MGLRQPFSCIGTLSTYILSQEIRQGQPGAEGGSRAWPPMARGVFAGIVLAINDPGMARTSGPRSCFMAVRHLEEVSVKTLEALSRAKSEALVGSMHGFWCCAASAGENLPCRYAKPVVLGDCVVLILASVTVCLLFSATEG